MSPMLISAVDLAARLTEPNLLLIDVRHDLMDHAAGQAAYEQGHIPGAIFLDHETQLAAPKTGANGRHPLPSRADLVALMAAYGCTPESDVVVYDASNGAFAAHLWWMLRWVGHTKVQLLDGGWRAWLATGAAVETGPAPKPRAVSLALALPRQTMPVLDVTAVVNNLTQPTFTVIDARDSARFLGQAEPIDPVAGHIPGALNRPNSMNVQPDGRFKPAAQLRQEFEVLLQGRAPQDIVHQCGSGITACHNLFAMELAGFSGSALYPGSWSEWCSDPSRPVATSAEPA